METTKQKNEPRECCVAGDGLQPVIYSLCERLLIKQKRGWHTVKTEQHHLGLCCALKVVEGESENSIHSCRVTYQDEITELLHLHASLERKLQLTPLDDDVGEIKQMDLEGVYRS